MVKTLLFFIFFTIFVYGDIQPIKSDFKPCFERTKKSFIKIRGRDFIAIKRDKAVIFSKRYIKGAIKSDPFLGLYLVKTKRTLTPITFSDFKELTNYKTVSVTKKDGYRLVSVVSLGDPLESFAKLSKSVKANGVLESVCCKKFGITTGGKGFIDSDFINHFLKNKRVVYGDCGIEIVKKGKKFYVKEIDPFFGYLKLRVADEILTIDGKRFSTLTALEKYILFSKPGKVITIKYKRGKRIYMQKVKIRKRISGGLISGTYFERIGLFIGGDLRVKNILKGSLAYGLGLKKGDKLMKIDDSYIRRYKDINPVLSRVKKRVLYLLFSRDDFQFFVHFRR